MNAKIFTGIVALVGTGFIGGYAVHDFLSKEKPDQSLAKETVSEQVRQNGSYTFINPLLECEVAEGSIDARKENFEAELAAFTKRLEKEKKLADAALYFRDLNNGPAFGVNIQDEFFPASLLKVPVMMAYYRWSEKENQLLNTKISYEKKADLGYIPTIVPKEELVVGQAYTVDELIRRMIIYSDNQAIYLLTKNLPKTYLSDLFAMLGVGEDVLTDESARLNVKEYASFFRILYNSSYLSRDNSEKALALLSVTDYHDALPAGIPSGVTVAHKFGEAGTMNVERQLHDCGIVYFPGHPYLACIMTRGQDPQLLKQSIADISRFIYEKIDEQY